MVHNASIKQQKAMGVNNSMGSTANSKSIEKARKEVSSQKRRGNDLLFANSLPCPLIEKVISFNNVKDRLS